MPEIHVVSIWIDVVPVRMLIMAMLVAAAGACAVSLMLRSYM
jgi:hypothetical protein